MKLGKHKNHEGTPICPGCGAKFSHDNTRMGCRVCGLPDEVVHQGQGAIREFNRQKLREQGLSRAEIKDERKRTGARKSRTKYKHGRTTKVRA